MKTKRLAKNNFQSVFIGTNKWLWFARAKHTHGATNWMHTTFIRIYHEYRCIPPMLLHYDGEIIVSVISRVGENIGTNCCSTSSRRVHQQAAAVLCICAVRLGDILKYHTRNIATSVFRSVFSVNIDRILLYDMPSHTNSRYKRRFI